MTSRLWLFNNPAGLAVHVRLGSQLPSRTHILADEGRNTFRSLCTDCGETDSTKFFSGSRSLCGRCRNRRQREKGKSVGAGESLD